MQPTIFAFGLPLPSIDRFSVLKIESNASWLDADIIVIQPSIATFATTGVYDGIPCLTKASSTDFRAFRTRWHNQLKTALDHDKLVIFLMGHHEPRAFYIEGGSKIGLTSNYTLVGSPMVDPSHVQGRQMDLAPHGVPIKDYWKSVGRYSQYNSLFGIRDSKPIITTKSGNQMCGCWVQDRGSLFVLPSIDWKGLEHGDLEQTDPSKEGYGYKVGQIEFARQLRQALVTIYKNLTTKDTPVAVPEWVSNPENNVGREAAILAELVDVEARREQLEAKHVELELEMASEQSLKALLYASGKPLEAAVRRALEILGFETSNYVSENSEFDVVFVSLEGRFIGEVEGRDNKAIAVDKASQLHRNIAEDFDRDEIDEMAKGVLFGNAFRTQPPPDRPEIFTDKAITFAATANIALVRTSDLFRAVQRYLASPDDAFAEKCRKAVTTSVGKIVKFPID